MKIPKLFQQEQGRPSNRIAMQGGSYSLILTAVVLAIVIVCNVLVSALPTSLTSFDISAAQLYSVTSNTKAVLSNLTQDVTIYWIVQADEEDAVIENLLGEYENLSDHIIVEKKNPDAYPTFAQQYTEEEVKNNSLVVECGERNRYISYDDIYLSEPDLYSYAYSTSFDGEGAITSAIDYVVREELPILYTLEGHGESELPATFADQIDKANIQVESLSLLTVDAIPEDASCVAIYAPTSDLSAQEVELLADYAEAGGKLLVMAGPTEENQLTNLYQLLSQYGVEPVEGIVVESDRESYAFGYPYVLLPTLESHEITQSLLDEHYYAILPLAQGLQVTGNTDAIVTELLTTSDTSFSKVAGFDLNTYEQEEGDIDGPFALAVSIETTGGGQIVWFSSSDFLDDRYNAFSSGANGDLAMNALSNLVGETEAMAIRSKSLNYNYLTISESVSSLLRTLMIGVFPLVYLGVGIVVVVRRKQVQHETV